MNAYKKLLLTANGFYWLFLSLYLKLSAAPIIKTMWWYCGGCFALSLICWLGAKMLRCLPETRRLILLLEGIFSLIFFPALMWVLFAEFARLALPLGKNPAQLIYIGAFVSIGLVIVDVIFHEEKKDEKEQSNTGA